MKMTFRWYGPETDPITLQNIRQIPGTSGIMGAMDSGRRGVVRGGDFLLRPEGQ